MDWKRKLSSRKFWVAVCGFVTALLTAFNMGEEAVKITAVIMAFGTLIGYLVAEGLVDAAAAQSTQSVASAAGTQSAQPAASAAGAQSAPPAASAAAEQSAAAKTADGAVEKA